jgi:hypothetical protein
MTIKELKEELLKVPGNYTIVKFKSYFHTSANESLVESAVELIQHYYVYAQLISLKESFEIRTYSTKAHERDTLKQYLAQSSYRTEEELVTEALTYWKRQIMNLLCNPEYQLIISKEQQQWLTTLLLMNEEEQKLMQERHDMTC